MADPERFDVVPDPTFHADADLDPDLALDPKRFSYEENFFSSKSLRICFKILLNLSYVFFSVTMREEGRG